NTKFGQTGALGQAMTNQNIANFGNQLWGNANQTANNNAMTAGAANLNTANTFDSNMVNGYNSMAQTGGNLVGNAYEMGMSNMDMGLQAGQLQQGYDQSLVDADIARWNFEQQSPWMTAQNKLAMLPSPGGYTPGTPGMSSFEGAVNGAQAGLGIYNAGQDAGWWGSGGTGGGGYEWESMTPDQFRTYLGG
ncbi:MAG: hypothetical protein ACPH5V_10435, partial [Alcanivorax sp.]